MSAHPIEVPMDVNKKSLNDEGDSFQDPSKYRLLVGNY